MREAMRASRPQANPARQRAFAEGIIKNFDKNGDGKLDVDELVAMQNARPQEVRRPVPGKDGKVVKGKPASKDQAEVGKCKKGKCKKADAKAGDGKKGVCACTECSCNGKVAACACPECACGGKGGKAKCGCKPAAEKVDTRKDGDK